jgi:hypothetical protein
LGCLAIRVELPPNLKIDGSPELLILRDESIEPRLQDAFAKYLTFDPAKNVIALQIPEPPLGLGYRVSWRLTNAAPPAGRPYGIADGEANLVITRLIDLAHDDPKNNLLSTVLIPVIEQEARVLLGLKSAEAEPLYLTIMVFDKKTCKLRIAAGNLDTDDPLWTVQLCYGDGIAGRSYKMNSPRLFIKEKSKQFENPFYYTDGTGNAPTDTGEEITEEVILAVPLSPPALPHVTFAVLNLSSRRKDSGLLGLTDDSITKFRHATSKACFEAIKGLSWIDE